MMTTTTRQPILTSPLIQKLTYALLALSIVASPIFGANNLTTIDPQPYRFGPEHSQPRILSGNRSLLYVENSVQNIWMYRPGEYRIDAEVYQLTVQSRTRLHKRLEVSLSIPLRYLSGGMLDGVIEYFHGRTGFNDSDRSAVPRADLTVEFGSERWDTHYILLDGRAEGWSLAEPALELNYVLPVNFADMAAHAYSRLPLRTGSEDLTGYLPSLGMSLAVGRQWHRFYTSLSYSVGHVSRSEFLGHPIRDWVYSTAVSFEYQTVSRRHTWWVQGIVQSGIAVDLPGLGDRRHQVMIGYSLRVARDWRLELGLLENLIRFDNTPDLGLHLGITRPLGF